MEDILLVRRCKEGDKLAFGELVNRYKERIYYTAYQLTNSHSDADDLSQEAFIRAYQSIGKFNEKSTFYTWLYRIVVNLSINHLKKIGHKREVSLDEDIILDDSKLAKPAYNIIKDSPREVLEAKELHEEITRAIESLPLVQKTVVVLVILQGLSYKEVAEIQRCSEGTIAWRLHQARMGLKRKLGPYIRGMQ